MQAYLNIEVLIGNKAKTIHRIKVEGLHCESIDLIHSRALDMFREWEKEQSWLRPGSCYTNLTIRAY